MHLLLIEPNPILARTYGNAFVHAGFTVSHATGAQRAIDAADKHQPDLVVLELQLSAHSGIEFLHEFRSYPEWQHIPVMVHTMIPPTSMDRGITEALKNELGVCAVLYKPRTNLQQLVRAVREEAAAI